MVTTTEGRESVRVSHRFLVPRLSLMMFMQFFIWGSWSVTLGLVMTRYEMSLLIGDAFSAGPIASILSPLCAGDAGGSLFRLAEGDGGDAPGRGGDPVVCPAGAGGAERRPADWPAVRLYAVLYADPGADQQYRLPQPRPMSIKPSRWSACSAPSAGLSPGSASG